MNYIYHAWITNYILKLNQFLSCHCKSMFAYKCRIQIAFPFFSLFHDNYLKHTQFKLMVSFFLFCMDVTMFWTSQGLCDRICVSAAFFVWPYSHTTVRLSLCLTPVVSDLSYIAGCLLCVFLCRYLCSRAKRRKQRVWYADFIPLSSQPISSQLFLFSPPVSFTPPAEGQLRQESTTKLWNQTIGRESDSWSSVWFCGEEPGLVRKVTIIRHFQISVGKHVTNAVQLLSN